MRRPPLIEVRHSPVHGYGVFALRRIRRGTTVIEYLGERVSHAVADARYEDKDPEDNHTFLFTVDARTVIDAGVGGNEARFINHGCDPNCQSVTRGRRIFIEALRTIRPGEELCYDYQIQRDADDPQDVDRIYACRCGAPACRGSMLEARRESRPRGAARARAASPARRRAKTRAAARPRSRAPAGANRGAGAGPKARSAARPATSGRRRSPARAGQGSRRRTRATRARVRGAPDAPSAAEGYGREALAGLSRSRSPARSGRCARAARRARAGCA